MRRSFHTRPAHREPAGFPFYRGLLVATLIGLCLSLIPSPHAASAFRQDAGSAWSEAVTSHFRVAVQGVDRTAAANFAVTHGGQLETAYRELTLLFPIPEPSERFPLTIYADQGLFDEAVLGSGRIEIPGISIMAGAAASEIMIFQPSFAKLSPVEAENQLRHAVSHLVTDLASGGKLPWGFAEGIAQYVERPVNEKLARTASIVQTAHTRGEIPAWFDMNRPNAFVEPSLAAAQAYAVIAFLIDEFELPKLRQFLVELRAAESWNDAMRLAYSGDPNDIESRWREKIPEWTSGAWRENLVAAFDLEPARRFMEQANYASAKEALTPSETLFDQIGDREQLAIVQDLIAQADIGIQAESLMTQAQQALEAHTYDRALNLLTQAELQFAQLPEEQRPTELLLQYRTLATQGIDAKTQLDSAVRLSHSWRDYSDARRAARNAGVAFAALGDEANVALAQAELDKLDQRQRRIVLLLVALAILTLIWLGLWLWARGPSELSWR
ncbi:MAG: hypothetical protein IT336_16455 [Thermomicrobiales bacterium]|nr:hypothetical protein [Thermomicrobiales bacterium]